MGPKPKELNRGMTTQGTYRQQDVMQVTALMATEVGKGMALGLQSLAPLHQDTTSQKGRSDNEGKGYTSDDIAALMGFAGVTNGADLPEIWEILNKNKGKNIDTYRRHIVVQMKQWAFDR